MKFWNKKSKGITLITLVITIIILIILAGTTINILLGENGLIAKVEASKEVNQKQTAKEAITLKITEAQIKNYTEKQEMPTLQNLADIFCDDKDFQYVELASKKQASLLPNIVLGEKNSSIFVKLKEYPYEFEINGDLRLASIDGITIETEVADTNEYVKKSDYDALLERVISLESGISNTYTKAESDEKYVTNSTPLSGIATKLGDTVTGVGENNKITYNSSGYKFLYIETAYVREETQCIFTSLVKVSSLTNDYSTTYCGSTDTSNNGASRTFCSHRVSNSNLYCINTQVGGTSYNSIASTTVYGIK